ncbi:MAG: hypothetical protein DRO99_05405, partial [Candidatus Aenigmatarchaeota archaeon]
MAGDASYSEDRTFETPDYLDIIPLPQVINEKGFYVPLDGWHIETHQNERYMFSARWLQDRMVSPLTITGIGNSVNRILLGNINDAQVKAALKDRGIEFPAGLGEEGYILDVFNDEIIIAANAPNGIFYGVQTLLQLLRYDNSVEAVSVTDWPDSKIRGVVISNRRSPLYIGKGNDDKPVFTESQKEYIDKLAAWKMNTLLLFDRDGFMWESDTEYIEPLVEIKQYLDKRFMKLIPTIGALKDFYNIPFYLGDGWYIQDEEFVFGTDNIAKPIKPSENMVIDGGFEAGGSGWTTTNNAQITSEEAHSGQNSLSITGWGNAYIVFDAEPGDIYHLSGYGRGVSPFFCLYAMDSEGNILYSLCDYANYVNNDYVTYWRQYGATIRANENTVKIKVILYPKYGYSEPTYFDDIRLFRLNGALKNVIRTATTDIVVTNMDKSVTYMEGIDYRIINGTTSKTFSPDLESFIIERLPGGSVSQNQHVLVNYDSIIYQKLSNGQSIPSCISDERLFTDLYYPAISRVIQYLRPEIIMLRGDEIRGFNRDSRDVKRGVTNAQLYAEWVNKLDSYAKSLDPGCRVMIWDDMVSPYHNGGVDYQLKYGGPPGQSADAVREDMLSKRAVIDVWWYSDDYFTQMADATRFFASKGFKYVGSPWYDLENIRSWSELIVDELQCIGGLDTSWHIGDIDIHYPYFADHIWNTRYKLIYFNGFENDSDNDGVPDSWLFTKDYEEESPNLILNPSFESDFDNWKIYNTYENTPDISLDSYDGSKSAHFISHSSSGSTISIDYYINVVPGKRYVWSGCGKTNNIITGTEGWHRLYGTGRFLNDSYQRPYADSNYMLDIGFSSGTHD